MMRLVARFAALIALVPMACGSTREVKPVGQASEGAVKPVACPPELAMDHQPLSAHEMQFFKPTEPKGTVSKHAVCATVRERSLTLAVAIDSAKADAKLPDLVRFDFTGKADFTGAPVAPLKVDRNEDGEVATTVGPATIEVKRDGKTIPVSVRGNYHKSPGYRWINLNFGTAVEGRLAFGDKTYAVRVVDGNNDLALGTKAQGLRAGDRVAGIEPCDALVVDTGDGSFAGKVLKAYYGQPVQVGGAWYDVELSPDGAKLTAKPSAAETASLKIAHARWAAKLAGEKYILTLSGSAEPAVIPADRYTIIEFEQTVPSDRPEDKEGWKGRLTSGRRDLWDGKGQTIEAAAGKTVELAIGAPLTASIVTSVQAPSQAPQKAGRPAPVAGSAVRMDFKLVDAAGLRAELFLPNAGAPTPEVEVFDAEGKSIHQAKFQFG